MTGAPSAPPVPDTKAGVPAATRRGIAACVLLFVAIATLSASTLPWTGSLDSRFHLDYAYNVYEGALPEPYGAELYRHPDAVGSGPEQPQYAAHHPPGYYALIAPLVGPSLDRDRYATAVGLARAANVALGALGTALLGWLGWLLGGRRRAALAVALPAIGTIMYPFARLGGDIYNDVALTTVTIATLVVTVSMLRHGISTRRIIAFSALSSMGMSVKATYLFVLVLTVGVVALSPLVRRERPWRAIIGSCTAVAAPVVTVGWFYLRNRGLSGSWFQALPDANFQGRAIRSVGDVLSDPRYWTIVPHRVLGGTDFDLAGLSVAFLSGVLMLGSLSVVAIVAFRSVLDGGVRGRVRRPEVLTTVLLVAMLGTMYLAQLDHAAGTGQYSIRYFLPALATIALIPALALIRAGRLGPAALGIVLVTGLSASAIDASRYFERRWPAETAGRGLVAQFGRFAETNGMPSALPVSIVVFAFAAIGMIVFAFRESIREDRLREGPIQS